MQTPGTSLENDWRDGGFKRFLWSDPQLDAIATSIGAKVRHWYDDLHVAGRFVLYGVEDASSSGVRHCPAYNVNLRRYLKEFCEQSGAFRRLKDDYKRVKKHQETLCHKLDLCVDAYEHLQKALDNPMHDISRGNLFEEMEETMSRAQHHQKQLRELLIEMYDIKRGACRLLGLYQSVCHEFVTHVWRYAEHKRLLKICSEDRLDEVQRSLQFERSQAEVCNLRRRKLLADAEVPPTKESSDSDSDESQHASSLAQRASYLQGSNHSIPSMECASKEHSEKMVCTVSTAATNRTLSP